MLWVGDEEGRISTLGGQDRAGQGRTGRQMDVTSQSQTWRTETVIALQIAGQPRHPVALPDELPWWFMRAGPRVRTTKAIRGGSYGFRHRFTYPWLVPCSKWRVLQGSIVYLGIKHAGARCPGGLAHIRIGRTQHTEPAHADCSARVIAHDRGLRATRASRLPSTSTVAHGQPDNNRLITLRTHAGSA